MLFLTLLHYPWHHRLSNGPYVWTHGRISSLSCLYLQSLPCGQHFEWIFYAVAISLVEVWGKNVLEWQLSWRHFSLHSYRSCNRLMVSLWSRWAQRWLLGKASCRTADYHRSLFLVTWNPGFLHLHWSLLQPSRICSWICHLVILLSSLEMWKWPIFNHFTDSQLWRDFSQALLSSRFNGQYFSLYYYL